jgi:methionyl-tRNA synthetase
VPVLPRESRHSLIGGKSIAEDRYYITTAIPYVNSTPHIGFALEIVQTDSFARYHRLRGDDTYFLTGTDENALKNVQAAEQEGVPVEQLVRRNRRRYQDLKSILDLSFDQFIATAEDPEHRAGAEKIWRAIDAAGDIYKKQYVGLYCVGCEQFYDEAELDGGLCPEHGTVPDRVEEENYFFRLSRYAGQLEELISSDRYRVIPETRKNEVLSFIRQGLQDFSISRSQERAKGWGIRVPDDPSQVMYVWFDALANYITALGYAEESEKYRRYWLENPHRTHAIGKGVIRFHAIYWPAMLLSAGVPLPETLFVHGYITIGGSKMSKSVGNVVDPLQLVDQYGAEAVRYYLLRAVSATGDHSFSYEGFEARYTADLANDLGNLVNRTVSMIHRYRDGVIPAPDDSSGLENQLRDVAEQVGPKIGAALDAYDPQSSLNALWELVIAANRYVEETAPWTLAAQAKKEGDEQAAVRLSTVLHALAETVRVIAGFLEPFVPATSERIYNQLGVSAEGTNWTTRIRWGGLVISGTEVREPQPLFPRLEPREAEASA